MNIENKSKGFVAIFRSITEWEWYDDLPTRTLFLDLLFRCNWKAKKWQGEVVNAGEIITSINHLAQTSGLSENQVRTALKKLKSTNEITIKTTNKYTKITINKFGAYQSIDDEKNEQITDKSQTNNNQLTNGGQTNHKQITTTKPSNQENHLNQDNQETIIKISKFENLVFEKFNSIDVIQHQKFTKEMKKAIAKAKKNFTEDEILMAIERYGKIYNDTQNEYAKKYGKYKWTLKELLTREKGISEFLDEGAKWKRYTAKQTQTQEAEDEPVQQYKKLDYELTDEEKKFYAEIEKPLFERGNA